MSDARVVTLAIMLLVPTATVAQEGKPCQPEATFVPDKANRIPAGFTASDVVELIGKDDKPISAQNAVTVDKNTETFTVSSVALLQNPFLRWRKTDGSASCEQRQASATDARAVERRSTVMSDAAQQCIEAGHAATRQAAAARGGQQDFTVILLNDLGVCYANRHFSTEGDPIYIGYARTDESTAALEFEKCEAASAIPKVLIGGDIAAIKPEAARPVKVQWFTPAPQCFGTSVEFHLNKPNAPKFVKATITQYERYRATLQLGAAFTERHIQSFGLRQEGEKKFLVSKGPADERGPEYLAAVVIYGVPNYFRRRSVADPAFLDPTGTAPRRKDPYFGREPVHENGPADRLGLILGVALSQPGRRLVVGGSFEVLTGVNVVAVREFVRLTKLNGFDVGDEFSGAADAIPLRDDWENGWTFGITFDARYAVALFGKK